MDRLGAHSFWGPSGALDLLGSDLTEITGDASEEEQDFFWVLQICAGDCRHVLRTLCTYFRNGAGEACSSRARPLGLGFRIYERDVELLARQMLLLLIMFDTERDVKERVDLFLEVHGNVELTEKGEADVDYYAQKLEAWITSLKPNQVSSVLRFFDVSDLKLSLGHNRLKNVT